MPSALVGAVVWDVLTPANPGQENRAPELPAEKLSLQVYHPGGAGTWLKGGSAVILGKEPSTGLEAALGQALSAIADPKGKARSHGYSGSGGMVTTTRGT